MKLKLANVRAMRNGAYIANALLILLALRASAATFNYIKIADNATDFFSFTDPGRDTRPGLNNNGTVAFWAQPATGVWGIYSGSGGPLTLITDYSSGPVSIVNSDLSISDAGNVALSVHTKDGHDAVLTGNGGPLMTVEDDTSPRHNYSLSKAIINKDGFVAFTAERDTGNASPGTYLNSGGTTSLIAERGTSGTSITYSSFFARDANNSGKIAMTTGGSSPPTAIYVGSGGPVTLVVERSGGIGDCCPYLSDPSINDAGDVIYAATTPGVSSTIPWVGIYKYSGGVTTTVVAPTISNGISNVTVPQINNQGVIAYNSSAGIRIGNGLTFGNVISQGDPLFGSTVQFLGTFSLNDHGDVAFVYNLVNGRRGVALAMAVPEPSTFLLGSICIVVMMRRPRV